MHDTLRDSGAFETQIFSFYWIALACSSFPLPLLWIGRVISFAVRVTVVTLVKVSAVGGRSFINMFNQLFSYASVKCWRKLIYGESFKKTLRFLAEFIQKRHLIFKIRLKFRQQEGQKVQNFVLRFVLHACKFPNFATKFGTSSETM